MKINYNISAMISNDHLLFNETRLSSSTERLSSGLKVNRAQDDPTGIAIGIKMRNQIRGLEAAENNSKNGTSLIETADGALGEMTSILQRMRELSVQAANDTQTPQDRQNIQLEIDELIEEVDRISDDSEFNTLKLFDGTLNTRAYASITNSDGSAHANPNSVTIIDTKDVTTGTYVFTVDTAATRGEITTGVTSRYPQSGGSMFINGVSVEISASSSDFWDSLKDACDYANVDVTCDTGQFEWGTSSLTFTSRTYGDSVPLTVSWSDGNTAAIIGLGSRAAQHEYTVTGDDATITLDSSSSSEGFTGSESYVVDGQRITIHGANGFEMIVEAQYAGTVTIEQTDIGSLYLQVGANEHQSITVDIPELSAHNLGIDAINVRNSQGAGQAIDLMDVAIEKVNKVRATLGAAQNRLEHTEKNLDTSQETLTSAYSRIMDVDMAEEMTEFTNMQILVQAGTSVLAQANELPDQALQMLR